MMQKQIELDVMGVIDTLSNNIGTNIKDMALKDAYIKALEQRIEVLEMKLSEQIAADTLT